MCTFTAKCGHVSWRCAKYGDPAGFKECQDMQMAGLGSTIDMIRVVLLSHTDRPDCKAVIMLKIYSTKNRKKIKTLFLLSLYILIYIPLWQAPLMLSDWLMLGTFLERWGFGEVSKIAIYWILMVGRLHVFVNRLRQQHTCHAFNPTALELYRNV